MLIRGCDVQDTIYEYTKIKKLHTFTTIIHTILPQNSLTLVTYSFNKSPYHPEYVLKFLFDISNIFFIISLKCSTLNAGGFNGPLPKIFPLISSAFNSACMLLEGTLLTEFFTYTSKHFLNAFFVMVVVAANTGLVTGSVQNSK